MVVSADGSERMHLCTNRHTIPRL
eukprot:COSAG02_NODE_47257_length_342_cov_1.065844_1_plen_23_part_10